MDAGDRQAKTRRARGLALLAAFWWALVPVSAAIGLPWFVGAGITAAGFAFGIALWFALGSLHKGNPVIAAIAPSRTLTGAFENPEPVASVQRASAEIERLREIEHQLRLAKQEAEAATLAKGEFLATMSHEIRTPLNGIVPLIDVVLSSQLNVDQRQCLETAYVSAQQLLSIVDDILDYSKIEANRLELESVSVNLRELVDSVAQLMAHPAQAKGLVLNVRFDPQLRPIQRGDPVRLRQLLTNLVSNSVKFTERGNVTVQVSRRGETATHTQVLFAIVDTGVGIEPKAQSRLFQPFTQADTSVTREFGGTGLGLAICRRLVEIMGGEIGLKSATGQGSTFWFSVPLLKAPGDIAESTGVVDGMRALVVSADKDLIRELSTFFGSAGIQHTQTSLSADAVSRLRGNPNAPRGMQTSDYRFAFLDWSGMRLTAQSMARGLLRDPALSHLRIVLLSSPQDEIPDDLRHNAQVLIHPRVLDIPKLRAALDAEKTDEAPLATVDELLRAPDVSRDVAVSSPMAAARSLTAPEGAHAGAFVERRVASARSPSAADQPTGPVPAVVNPAAPERLVLLVEDNPVNRQVAQRLLSIGGLDVAVAEDGAVALARRFAAPPPLAILMDCQMPVMDGYAATRAIREREAREGLPRMPIIAMTANAMLGDREKCLQAGMDDYLSKPLDRRAMSQTLDRWLAVSEGRTTVMAKRREVLSLDGVEAGPETESAPLPTVREAPANMAAARARLAGSPAAVDPQGQPPVARSDAGTQSPPPGSTAGAAALDPDVIDDLVDMMGEDFADLVRMYLHDAPVHVAEVHAAALRDDFKGLAGPAHILKSSSANLGAMRLSAIAREIETGAKLETLQRPIDHAIALERAYMEASHELTRLLSLRNA